MLAIRSTQAWAQVSNVELVRTDLQGLAELRKTLGVPSGPEVDQLLEGDAAQRMMRAGATAEDVGRRLGISRRTVFERLRVIQSAESPLSTSIRKFCTLASSVDGGEAGP